MRGPPTARTSTPNFMSSFRRNGKLTSRGLRDTPAPLVKDNEACPRAMQSRAPCPIDAQELGWRGPSVAAQPNGANSLRLGLFAHCIEERGLNELPNHLSLRTAFCMGWTSPGSLTSPAGGYALARGPLACLVSDNVADFPPPATAQLNLTKTPCRWPSERWRRGDGIL